MKLSDLEIFKIIKSHFNKDHTYFLVQITGDTLIEINYYNNVSQYLVSNYLMTSGGMLETLKNQFLMQRTYNINEIRRVRYTSLPKMVKQSIRENLTDWYSRHPLKSNI